MANKKISQLTPKGSALAGTDLLEVSVFNGVTYDTKSLTGANVVSGLQPTLVSGTSIKTINSTTLLGSGDIAVQPTLVSATNIKTINSTTLLGSGDVAVQPTLVSATNIKTINSTTLLGSGDIAVQPTLVSATNIKTINSISLLGSGDIVIGGGSLTVGTTAIASGTVGRVLFEGTGNVVQQDSTLFWDNTNKRLGVGATPSSSVRLDVRAQGALSTDIALRVRNSANTGDLLSVQGDGRYALSDGGGTTSNAFSYIADGRMFMAKSGSNFIELNTGTTQNRMYMTSNGLEINVGASSKFEVLCSTTSFRVLQNCVEINSGAQASSGTNYLMMQNGTAPSANAVDHYNLYSADIVAGNAAPHFRTENGNIIKLYQQTTAVAAATVVNGTGGTVKHDDTFDGYTLQQVVKALRNAGLLA